MATEQLGENNSSTATAYLDAKGGSMLLLQTLLACTTLVSPAQQLTSQPLSNRPFLHVSLVARTDDSAAWTARISAHTQPIASSDVLAGQCTPLSIPTPTPEHPAWASTVTLSLPKSLPLTWDGEAWRTTGPILGQDPAWVTADLGWHNGQSHLASGAVRFGETPQVQSIERQQDGSVQLRWQNRTANKQVILTQSIDTGITLVCGTMRDGATLPAWAAPKNGTIILRSTRTRISEQDQTLILGDATIEQPIQLDSSLQEPPPVTPSRPQIPDTHRDIGLLKKKRDRKG